MTPDIDSGFVIPQFAPHTRTQSYKPNPDEMVPFWAPEITDSTTTSTRFEVMNTQALLVTAYNMPSTGQIDVYRLYTGNPNAPQGCTCGPDFPPDLHGPSSIVYERAKMTLGCPDCWHLSADTLQLLIAIPGWYVLQLSDEDMLDSSMTVTGIRLNLSTMPWIPSNYFAGVCCNTFT